MTILKQLFLYLLIFTLSLCSFAQESSKITPTLTKGKKTIGDVITYRYVLPNVTGVPSISLSFVDPSGNEDVVVLTQSVTVKNNRY